MYSVVIDGRLISGPFASSEAAEKQGAQELAEYISAGGNRDAGIVVLPHNGAPSAASAPPEHVCAEIEYPSEIGNVHSDICWSGEGSWTEYCVFLHDNLNEWLSRSGGKGAFYVGDIQPLWADELEQ